MKFTTSLDVTLKLCQFKNRLALVCTMVVVLPVSVTEPVPAVTCDPPGAACANPDKSSDAPNSVSAAM